MNKNTIDFTKDNISIIEIITAIINKRKLIIKTVATFFITGILFSLLSTNIYESSSSFYPHYENIDQGSSNLASLAGLAGINLDNETSNIPPTLYPEIIQSIEFKLKILDEKVYYNEGYIEYREYLLDQKGFNFFDIIKYPIVFLKNIIVPTKEFYPIDGLIYISEDDYELFKLLDDKILLNLNENDGFIKLSVYEEDKEISASIAKKANDLLQKSIIDFKLKNISDIYKFTQKQLEIAKNNLYMIQDSTARFRDQNKSIRSDLFSNELNRIESEEIIRKNIYNELALSVERTAIEVRKSTPIFTILNPVVVPNEKYYPKTIIICLLFSFFGFVFSVIWILFKSIIIKIYNSVQ